MLDRTTLRISVAATLLLTVGAGCGGGEREERPQPVTGAFVGKVADTEAFLAVVTNPAKQGRGPGGATVQVCDGTRVCDHFPASVTKKGLEGRSEGGDVRISGKLQGDAISGTLQLPGDRSIRYRATRATAAAGVYSLTVNRDGELDGASATGVALKGSSTAPERGKGTLRLADGRRLRFTVSSASGNPLGLPPGKVRVIVLPGGELRGAGRSPRAGGSEGASFYLRSSK